MSSTDEKFRAIMIGDDIVYRDRAGQRHQGKAEGWFTDDRGLHGLFVGQQKVRLYEVIERMRPGSETITWEPDQMNRDFCR